MTALKDAMRGILTRKELELLPTSFDVIGDIAIFNNFPDELREQQMAIAHMILRLNKNIKVVAKKVRERYGKYRRMKINIISGQKRKETTHKENGVLLKLDVEQCYFSPRLSTERLRVTKMIKSGEDVLVMFSGVAPYPCVIAKNSKAHEIYAVEANKKAHKYAQENIKVNKIKNVQLLCGDVEKVMPTIKKKFDRIIMPLPKTSKTFLELAYPLLKEGGILHMYQFATEQEFGQIKKQFEKIFKKVIIVRCGVFSPRVHRICLDLYN